MQIKRNAQAHWEGAGKTGKGTLTSDSAVLNQTQYSFNTRFEDGVGTTPEELVAAAHAGCYSMAPNATLEANGFVPIKVATEGNCTVEKIGDGMSITKLKLVTRAVVPNISSEKFLELAEATKTGCIVSKALASVPMELDAALEG